MMSNHDSSELSAWVPRLQGVRVLVVGDLILDRYVLSSPSRLSREAPVMIARFEGETLIPGGAANAALNVAALGGVASVIGVVGEDEDGTHLTRELRSQRRHRQRHPRGRSSDGGQDTVHGGGAAPHEAAGAANRSRA